MLIRLAVHDLALFDSLVLEFSAGLNVLTGETGAGKSLVAQALALCLGGKAQREMVRRGARRAAVEALFDVSTLPAAACRHLEAAELDAEESRELLIRRVVGADGRSRAFINDHQVTLAFLRDLGTHLADLHGQHDHQALLDVRQHGLVFDVAAKLEAVRLQVAAARDVALDARRQLDRYRQSIQETRRRRFDLEERLRDIEAVDPAPGEFEQLKRQAVGARHADRVRAALAAARPLLADEEGAAAEHIGRAESLLAEWIELDPFFEQAVATLATVRGQVLEIAQAAEAFATDMADAEVDVERLEERLAAMERLDRVYGGVEAALVMADEIRLRLADLEQPSQETALESTYAAAVATLEECAASLSVARAREAKRLGKRVQSELVALGFPKGAFRVLLERRVGETPLERIGDDGAESVEFVMAPNVGEGERPLARIASGGELARTMLAIRSALAGKGGAMTMLFDEIDAAIGGVVLDAVADRLTRLSKNRQLICITHEPRIAARAHRHLRVAKGTAGDRTQTVVHVLRDEERESELARMLGGEQPGAAARAHARELLGR